MADRDFVIRAAQGEKFRAATAEKIMTEVVAEQLAGEIFSMLTVEDLGRKISDAINQRLKDLNLPRYKFIVQVMIGESRGQGVHAMSQCVWDADVDGMATINYNLNNIWCQATAFAIFTY
ncbi:dylt-2 [Pristionchus pacificus]|uniref:Dylt-2 n=1 Tax=Pristionchus pacificus TaxID=54126 RepID=A0A2A6B4X4_PRIPA|nr:dylt-2 [Pristionchus pacificus]|eukprot:PDM60929.1 dylt-2 [Pristionchus pacificus]